MINAFWLGLEFLSAIRPYGPVRYDAKSFSRSLIFFPIVGLILGALQLALLLILRQHPIPISLQSILLISVNLLFTGGLHLDGVADTADGFGSGGNAERILAIMKDERLGAFGAAAIGLLLYSKILVYDLICERNDVLLLLFAPSLSRFFLAATILILPYARRLGKALPFAQARYSIPSSIALLSFIPLFIFLTKEPMILFLSMILWVLFQGYIFARIHGYTGDTLGCLNEFLEVGIPFSYLCF